ncbi:MAG: MBL fold metallo-hydrolase [Pseudonocardiaceae bacterium]|nr:MBL fold metallo-hydrolase [Pseudonocardiaceae bacterium]
MGMKVYGLRLGTFSVDIEHLMWDHPKYMLLPGSGEKKKVWYQCPAMAYVVEHPQGRILFETGVSPQWREEWPEEWKALAGWDEIKPGDFLEAKLKSVGLGPEDFRYVVMGHMHIDHAGGLRLFEDADVDILIHEDEYRGVAQLEESAAAVSLADFAILPRKRPTLVYGDEEIMEGVRLLSLPGHTWGTMGMLVQLAHTGAIMFTTDALYHHEAYGPPPVGSGVTMFPDKWQRSMEKVYRYAQTHEALVVPGHDDVAVKQLPGGKSKMVELAYGPESAYE